MECRSGEKVTHKHTNLVLCLLNIRKKQWEKDYSNDPTKKRAVWYAAANLIELKDEVIIPIRVK